MVKTIKAREKAVCRFQEPTCFLCGSIHQQVVGLFCNGLCCPSTVRKHAKHSASGSFVPRKVMQFKRRSEK
jgi:hypothetical protein